MSRQREDIAHASSGVVIHHSVMGGREYLTYETLSDICTQMEYMQLHDMFPQATCRHCFV